MSRIRIVIGGAALLAIGVATNSIWDPSVSANAPTCCTSATDCPGQYDKCCAVSGSTCSSSIPNECVPCNGSPCNC